MADVRRNDDAGRYELWLDGDLVGHTRFAPRPDGALVFPHTEIDEERRGEGLGGELIAGALDDVRSRGESIVPECRAVAGFIDDNPAYADLVAPGA